VVVILNQVAEIFEKVIFIHLQILLFIKSSPPPLIDSLFA